MSTILIILGLFITVVLSIGIPTLLFSYAFALPWLKALAVTFAIAMTARSGSK